MNYQLLIASFIGIGFSMAGLYYLLRRPQEEMDEYFEYNKLFMMYIIGMGLGMAATVLNAWYASTPGMLPSPNYFLSDLIWVVFGFAIFETLIKYIVLNLKRFSKKQDTIAYGASLGFGYGAVMALGTSFTSFYVHPDVAYTPYGVFVIVTGGFALVFIHGAVGCTLGYVAATSKFFKYAMLALIYQAIFNFLALMALYARFYDIPEFSALMVASEAVLAAGVFWYTKQNIVTEALPLQIKRYERRLFRKLAKKE